MSISPIELPPAFGTWIKRGNPAVSDGNHNVSVVIMQPMSAATSETQERTSVFAPTIPGLPSGYTGVARELVEASQRQRLLHAVTVTVADKGYGPARIFDITAVAGVSKKTFYEHFPDKPACFLAAHHGGCEAMLEAALRPSPDALRAGPDPIDPPP